MAYPVHMDEEMFYHYGDLVHTKFYHFLPADPSIITIDSIELVTWDNGIIGWDNIDQPGKELYLLFQTQSMAPLGDGSICKQGECFITDITMTTYCPVFFMGNIGLTVRITFAGYRHHPHFVTTGDRSILRKAAKTWYNV